MSLALNSRVTGKYAVIGAQMTASPQMTADAQEHHPDVETLHLLDLCF